jgi:aminoglycoside 2'-N-acetyltransferase I
MAMVRSLASDELSAGDVAVLRELLRAAFGDDPEEEFGEDDWEHAVGGVHFLAEEDGAIVAHASVVERELHAGDHRLATGYVEAVATWPAQQRRGHGSAVIQRVNEHIDRTFQLGALGTGRHSFYGRLGWVAWKGPTYVRTDSGLLRTQEDDGFVLVRLTPRSPGLDLSAPISCYWRRGDVW